MTWWGLSKEYKKISQCNEHINSLKRKTMYDHFSRCTKSAWQNSASLLS